MPPELTQKPRDDPGDGLESETPGEREAMWARHQLRWTDLVQTHPLQYLFLEVTRRCNLRCAYCGSDCNHGPRADELGAEEWIGVVRQIAGDFEPAKVMIAVTGGEPLLKSGIFTLFEELARLGFPYGMVTNGFFLNRETAARLVATKIGSVSISMDAPGPTNDEMRGPGASDKVREALAHLREAGFSGKLEVISTITRPVVPMLSAMRRHLSALRVPHWRLAPVIPIGRAAGRPDLVPGPAEIRQLLEYVRQARRDRLLPRPEFCEEGFVGNRFEGVVRRHLAECRAGITVGGIRANGGIGACPELGEAFTQGNIRSERFRDVWEDRYQVFRDRQWTKRGRCGTCHEYARCRGGSLHLYASPQAELQRCLYWMVKDAEEQRGRPIPD